MSVARYSLALGRFLVLLALALSATACATPPGERQVKQLLGLERMFPHNDVPAAPSPSGYVLQLGMGQTHRIVVREQPGARQGDVTDPQTIQTILDVLRAGSTATAPALAPTPQTPIQLDFMAGLPERTVKAYYNPANQTLLLYNVPTSAWPDHAVGTYIVTPAFGAALLAALSTNVARPTP